MQFRSKIFVGLLTMLGMASGAHAQTVTDTLQKIKDSGTVVIGHRDASIPFSYLDDNQQPIGYSMDICMKVVEAIKAEIHMPNLQVKMNPVTSATRIPLHMQTATLTWSAVRLPTIWAGKNK
jgi:glutamate/aspartate transport system substrate-binding protein